MMLAEAFRDVVGEAKIIHGSLYTRGWTPDDLLLSQVGSLDVFTKAERRDIRIKCLAQGCIVTGLGGDPGPLASVLALEVMDLERAILAALEASDCPEAVRASISHELGQHFDL